jgi:hypothetical protein
MIAIAARASRGAAVPNRKQTRAHIIASFKKQMKALRARLNVFLNIYLSIIQVVLNAVHSRVLTYPVKSVSLTTLGKHQTRTHTLQ